MHIHTEAVLSRMLGRMVVLVSCHQGLKILVSFQFGFEGIFDVFDAITMVLVLPKDHFNLRNCERMGKICM